MRKIKVIEQFRQGKQGNLETCEDGLFISDDYIVVIDGATARTPTKWQDKAPGRIATEQIIKALDQNKKAETLEELFSAINQKILGWYQDQDIVDFMKKNPSQRASASLIVYSVKHNQLWMLGDCQALVDGKDHYTNEKRIDMISAEFRCIVLETEIRAGKTVEELLKYDIGREEVVPFIERQGLLQNTEGPYSFAVMDGFFTDFGRIKVIELDDDTKEIILTSDGYPEIKTTLKETEKHLEKILKKDPLCFREIKATKGKVDGNVSFDDRTYLKAQITK